MIPCKFCGKLDWDKKDKYDRCYCDEIGRYVDPESPGCKYNDKTENGKDPT